VRIEDHFVVKAPRQQVWAAITDPAVVAPCVPGCQGVTVVSPTLYKAKIRVQLGVIKADFNVEVELTEQSPPEQLRSRARGEEGSRASSVSAENVLRLIARSTDETEVTYSSEVSVVGRLGKFGLGVMKKKAESLGRDFATAFKARIEAVPAQG
jgi:carbon monoxide dehydrogenase subunit G